MRFEPENRTRHSFTRARCPCHASDHGRDAHATGSVARAACQRAAGGIGWRAYLKFLHYTFFAVLGAAAGTWATHRFSAVELAGERAPQVVYLPALEAPTVEVGPSVAEARAEELAKVNAVLAVELAEVREALARTRENLAELRRPMDADVMSSALRAELKSGEVVVTGGYRLPDGTRLYAFVQPFVEQAPDGADMVRISSQFRSLADGVGAAAGLDNLATNAANTLQHGEVWVADEQREILELIDPIPGVSGMSAPSVTVKPGASSVIELGDMRLKVTPLLAADRESLDFEVRLEQPQVVGEPVSDAGADAVPLVAIV